MSTRVSRRFKPVNMNGCVLYLPLYVYGANAQKAWDISGQGNHGIISGSGPGSEPVVADVEKITNGTFTGSATGWTLGTGWTYGSNKVTKTAGTPSDLEQDVTVTAGNRYLTTYILTRTAGTMTPRLGGVDGTARSVAGYYSEEIVATTTGNLKFQGDASFAGTVDGVTCREVLAHYSLGWSFRKGSSNLLTIPDFLDVGNSMQEISVLVWAFSHPYPANAFVQHCDVVGNQVSWIVERISGTDDYSAVFLGAVSDNGQAIPTHLKYYQGSVYSNALKWKCYGLTFNAGTFSLYFQGILDPNPTKTMDVTFTTIHNSTVALIVGGEISGGVPTTQLSGAIGEVLIFNRALSTQEHRDYFEMTRHRYSV